MMALITLLPAGKKIKIAPHQTIAAALRQAGYDFGSTCTHDAHCTSCRIALIDGQAQIDYGEFQQELQPLLQEENLVVACLATVKGNIILEAPLLLRPTKTAVRKRVRTAEEPSANPRSNPCSIIYASLSSNLDDAGSSSSSSSSSSSCEN
jgi:ferredoxin